mmetsp:Transcript_25775/g.31772  ORF Transcript_25775/g.31772 Transcript_25775/m.31772 type:complete len:211 (+) Transcript_25775:1003-1635(+)
MTHPIISAFSCSLIISFIKSKGLEYGKILFSSISSLLSITGLLPKAPLYAASLFCASVMADKSPTINEELSVFSSSEIRASKASSLSLTLICASCNNCSDCCNASKLLTMSSSVIESKLLVLTPKSAFKMANCSSASATAIRASCTSNSKILRANTVFASSSNENATFSVLSSYLASIKYFALAAKFPKLRLRPYQSFPMKRLYASLFPR